MPFVVHPLSNKLSLGRRHRACCLVPAQLSINEISSFYRIPFIFPAIWYFISSILCLFLCVSLLHLTAKVIGHVPKPPKILCWTNSFQHLELVKLAVRCPQRGEPDTTNIARVRLLRARGRWDRPLVCVAYMRYTKNLDPTYNPGHSLKEARLGNGL